MKPIDTEAFRSFVNGLLASIHANSPLPNEHSSEAEVLSKELSRQIRENSPKHFNRLWPEMRDIKRGLIAESVLEGLPLDPYFAIAASIQECVRISEVPPDKYENEPNWPEIIRFAEVRCRLYPHAYRHSDGVMRIMEIRSYALAEAALRMRERGYHCEIRHCAPFFEDSERERMIQAIEERIGVCGAIPVIEKLCRMLRGRFSSRMKRYLRPIDLNFTRTKTSSLPVNLLLQLALKQIKKRIIVFQRTEEAWKELTELATDFAALYDVEPYSHLELHFITIHTLVPYLRDIATYDRMFGFEQCRPSDVGKMLRGLFDWVPAVVEARMGWSIQEASRVAEVILSNGNPTGVNIFKRADVVAACHYIPAGRLLKILDVFTHRKPPNQSSTLPEIPGTITSGGKPLIRLDSTSFMVVDKALCSPAFYEAIATAVRLHETHENQTQERIGPAAERFLIAEMKARGVVVHFGKYKSAKEVLECDAVIETAETIIFLEVKAKALQSAARAGSDAAILIDLLRSLMKSTAQASCHEIHLRKNDCLLLKRPDGGETLLELKGREVEKIAATVLDFGSFQDRSVLDQVLGALQSAEIHPVDPSLAKQFFELNAMLSQLRGQLEELAKLDDRVLDQPFLNCWFLSIPQLLVLLDRVHSNESFKTELWRTRHLSTHSLDWYFEMENALNIHGVSG